MIRTLLLPAALLLTAGTAAAQDAGGIGFAPGGPSAANMAQAFAQPPRLPVFANAAPRGAPPGMMVTNPTVSRKSMHQQAITKIRGDAGFLGGFNKGQALAPSRQPPPPAFDFAPPVFIDAPFIVNNFNSALNFAFGDGNVSQQGVKTGGEPVPTPPPPTQPSAPAVPAMPKVDPLMSTAGPLPHLPHALETGGVTFNNVNSSINMAVGTGNTAMQKVRTVQK